MRRSFTLLILVFAFYAANAQDPEFRFRNNLADTIREKVDYSMAGPHALGSDISRKLLLIQETYTHVQKGTLTAPGDKTIVKKPDIYYSVKKLNAYYKKAVKKGLVDQQVAVKNLTSALEKSYSIYYQDTRKFEEYLRTKKTPEDIQKAFDQITLDK
jgi:hypothetical protein